MLYSKSKYKRIFILPQPFMAADITTEITLLQKQTTVLFLAYRQPFAYFPPLVVAGFRLHVSARHTDKLSHTQGRAHARFYIHTPMPLTSVN